MIDKLWSKPAEAWFPGGKTDPNLALLRFDIDDADLWADMDHLTCHEAQFLACQPERCIGDVHRHA